MKNMWEAVKQTTNLPIIQNEFMLRFRPWFFLTRETACLHWLDFWRENSTVLIFFSYCDFAPFRELLGHCSNGWPVICYRYVLSNFFHAFMHLSSDISFFECQLRIIIIPPRRCADAFYASIFGASKLLNIYDREMRPNLTWLLKRWPILDDEALLQLFCVGT